MGLIDKQVALDALTAQADEMSRWCERYQEQRKGVLTARNIIDDMPPTQQWIPWDSGRLPRESGTYTVTAYDGSGSRVTFAKYQKRFKRWELTGARAYWRVLAWMPLPEPWKGDKHEAE